MDLNMILICQNCKTELLLSKEKGKIQWLECETCHLKTPVVYGFPLFTESIKLNENITSDKSQYLLQCFSPKNSNYKKYIKQKISRNIFEIYAAMQPFNESSRAFFPFIEEVSKILKDGDIIVDTWARTGWHALLLSALFPKQKVIALWDGNSSVLGYSGYGYWFSEEKRPKNLEIFFVEANKYLPIKSNTVSFVFAHDAMHRYEFPFYHSELIRISKSNAFIMMPHIHLSDSSPEPFFKRGGELRESIDYEEAINNKLDRTEQEFLLMSEVELFNYKKNTILKKLDEVSDYNGFGLIANKKFFKKKFTDITQEKIILSSRLLVNPLLTINPFTGDILWKNDVIGDYLQYYLKRHPCYEKKIQVSMNEKLSGDCIKLLLLIVDVNLTLEEHASRLDWEGDYCLKVTAILYRLELVMPLPVSQLAIELQRFHNNYSSFLQRNFIDFWKFMLSTYPKQEILELEGNMITVEETHQLISAMSGYYLRQSFNEIIEISDMSDKVKLKINMMSAWWIGKKAKIVNGSDENEFWSIIEDNIHIKTSAIYNDSNNSPSWYEELFIDPNMKLNISINKQ